MSEHKGKASNRVYCNTANLKEIKIACDDAVERVRTNADERFSRVVRTAGRETRALLLKAAQTTSAFSSNPLFSRTFSMMCVWLSPRLDLSW